MNLPRQVPRKLSLSFAAALPAAVALMSCAGRRTDHHRVAGSPSATVTLDGKQLPAPPMKFGGVIRKAPQIRLLTGRRASCPQGRTDVLLIMTDDQGYGVSGTFGGVIPTPSSIASQRPDCATRSFTRRRCADPRGPR